MTISIACPNGHQLKAKDKLAGKTLPCPKCGAKIEVPALEVEELELIEVEPVAADADDDDEYKISALPEAETKPAPLSLAEATGRPAAPLQSAASRQSASGPDKSSEMGKFLVFGIAGGVVLGGVVLAVCAFFLFSGPPSPATADANEETSEPEPEVKPRRPASLFSALGVDGPRSKLKRLGLAFQNMHDRERGFLPKNDNGSLGERRLSWRVHLLPYIDQKPLYEEFHLDEPWDSPHNIKLVKAMPDLYRLGNESETKTRLRILSGKDMVFDFTNLAAGNKVKKSPDMSSVSDGISHTILVIVAGDDRAVSWTKPEPLALSETNPKESLGNMPDGVIRCVMVNGKTLFVSTDIDDKSLLALATARGKEIVDSGNIKRKYGKSY